MPSPLEWINIAKQHRHAGRLEAAEVACRQGLEENRDNTQLLHLLSVVLYETRKLPESLQAIERAISINGSITSYHNNRAVLLYEMGQMAEAEISLKRAIALDSKNASAYNNLGNAQRFLGKLDEAVASFKQALQIQPNHAEALNNLAVTLRELGRLDEAYDAWRAALNLSPKSAEISYNLSMLMVLRDQVDEAEMLLRDAITINPSYPPLYRGLVNLLLHDNRWNEANQVANEASKLLLPGRELSYINRMVYSKLLGNDYTQLFLDEPLLDAYESAIRKAVTPRSTMLEISDGHGLFAMMAARSGIQQSYVAALSRQMTGLIKQVVQANGLAQRITVLKEKSTRLKVGDHLPEPVDVLVYSHFGPGLLQPGTIIHLQHAKNSLLKPGARVIPAAARVFAMLIEATSLSKTNPIGNVRGFDYSHFDVLRPDSFKLFDYTQDQYQAITDPFQAMDFEFNKHINLQGKNLLELVTLNNGLCHGVMFWYDLYLDEQVVFSPTNHVQQRYWRQMVQFFEQPFHVTKGDTLNLYACWDENRIYFEIPK